MTSDRDEELDTPALSVRDLGEFGLIDRLAGKVGDSHAVMGIGDDTAVLDVGGPDYTLATVDMMVEGVHFELVGTDPFVVGRRALAINISDIAAMGGEPTHALVSLALPPDCPAALIDRVYEGLVYEAGLTGTGIVGGNITSTSGPMCIDVTVLGRVPRGEVVLRSGAHPGDILAVTGALGDAAAQRLVREAKEDPTMIVWADEPPTVPIPRVTVSRRLATAHLLQAMLDLSDGLAGDIRHLCRASGVGAVIYEDRLPISPHTRAVADALGRAPASLAMSGGEDYELLMALSPRDLPRATAAVGDVPLTVIGEVVTEEEGVNLVDKSGERSELRPSGWTHF